MNFKLVESTQNGVIKKTVAFMLIVVLTMFDFILLGTEMVSYAADALETATSNKNVTFDIYFKDENGIITTEKDEKINSQDIKLFVRVAVKNDGYFNGMVSLEEGNFNLKNEVLHTSINKIENNTITLNQINSGEVVEFEVGIEPIKEDTINSRFFNMSSKISINGIYRNSKEKDIKINATREVKLKLISPYTETEKVDLTTTILTNKVYEVEETNKRIVQVLVESGLNGNEYPIKENNIEVSVPDGVENVEVKSRGILATNGNKETEFTSNNWKYSEKDHKVSVSIKNDKEPIKWIKTGKDVIVVTFIMNPENNISGTDITARSVITLYNEARTIEGIALSKILEEKDGTVTTGIKLEESEIYKGKIYSGENRDYKLAEEIYINSDKISQDINVELNGSTFGTLNGEIPANIQYKNTRISKTDVIRILGTEGSLTISTQDGTTIAEINNQSETDENGYITINYSDGITALKVTTTKAVEAGTISLENTKTIKQDNNSKDIKRTYNSIIERMTDVETVMELKETETRAEVKTNKKTLSTLATNENIEIEVTLATSNEKNDLFKNPSFEITLPELINDINVKSIQPVYSEMFRVVNTQVVEGNNKSRIIRFSLEGEQTNYTSEVNQTTILITADIQFDLLAPSFNTAINMNYTNQNGTQGIYTVNQPIEVESKYGLMMYTTMNGYNEENEKITTMDDEVVKGSLDLEKGAKNATVKEILINNYDETMENVSIIGRIPTEGMNDGTINTKLTGSVKTSIPNAQVLYSTDANANAEDSTWQANSEGAKSFKIDAANLEKGAVVETEYSFEVPENIDYGQTMITKLDANYTYLGNVMAQTSTLGAETVKLTGVTIAPLKNSVSTETNGLKVEIGTTTAGRELTDGASVYEGQAIEYTVHITNNTGNNLNNVNISVEQENGIMYGLKEVEVYPGPAKYNNTQYEIEHVYKELDTNTKTFNTINTFNNGQTIEFKYEIVTNGDEGSQTKGEIAIKADDFDETKINTISNNIEQAELKLNYKYINNEEITLYSGQVVSTFFNIKNITNNTLENVEAKIFLPEGSFVKDNFYFASREIENEEVKDERVSNVKYNEENNTITFNISEIKTNDDINMSIYTYVNSFQERTKELVFLAEAKTLQDKSYYSNVLTKEMNNIVTDIEFSQEADIDDQTVLQDGQEFNITIIGKNNSDKSIQAFIKDELPDCFTVVDSHIEGVNIENNNYISNGLLNIETQLGANQFIKIVLHIRVSAYNAEKNVTNTALLEYGELGDHGVTIYVQSLNNEKTFNIDAFDNPEEKQYIEVEQTANVENKSTIKDGQDIVYSAVIKNTGNNLALVSIRDALPMGINAKEITLDNTNISDSMTNSNLLNIDNFILEKGQTSELKIAANYDQSGAVDEELANVVDITSLGNTVSSNVITYYANFEEQGNSTPVIDSDNPTPIPAPNQDDPTSTAIPEDINVEYSISGIAWLDLNKNGQRDLNEELLPEIEVKIIDVDTGNFVQKDGVDLSTRTSNNGTYSFKLQRGNYVVVFMYDSNKYAVTQYQRAGVADSQNSDVINKTIAVNGNNVDAALTDTIKLVSEDAKYIDLGLLENTKFDLELDKYVDEITVRTSKGTNTYTYNNAELAKVEIHAKELNNANVIIKYKLRITNSGEIAGYVKDLTDYIPTALTFNSELNTDWYQSNNGLHNISLLNTKIAAGETKDITLILTKNMTESNTGLISNLAELTDVSNELSVSDTDSTPGNKSQGEDDLGKADVIISVKTGALVMYVSIVITMLILIGAGALIINKKLLKNNNIKEDIDF